MMKHPDPEHHMNNKSICMHYSLSMFITNIHIFHYNYNALKRTYHIISLYMIPKNIAKASGRVPPEDSPFSRASVASASEVGGHGKTREEHVSGERY
jgi:hypothetical protein